MPLRAQGLLHFVGEPYSVRVLGQPQRPQLVDAARAHAALDDVRRHVERLDPIRGEQHRGKMRPGRMAGHVDALGIAAEAFAVFVEPDDRAPELIGEHAQVSPRLLQRGEIRHRKMRPRLHKHLRRKAVVTCSAAPPVAAVNEQIDRRGRSCGRVQVHAFRRSRAICQPLGLADALPHQFAVARAALEDLPHVRGMQRLVIGVVQRLLVQVEPDRWAFGVRRLVRLGPCRAGRGECRSRPRKQPAAGDPASRHTQQRPDTRRNSAVL